MKVEDVVNALREWAQDGEQLFAALSRVDSGSTASSGAIRLAASPVPLLGMQFHTGIALPRLMRIFRVDRTGIGLSIDPVWRTSSNAERIRCVVTLTLMAAQLAHPGGGVGKGVPIVELERRCRTVPSVVVHRGDVRRALQRVRSEDAYQIGEASAPVSLSTVEDHGYRSLTTQARDACERAVAAVLPLTPTP